MLHGHPHRGGHDRRFARGGRFGLGRFFAHGDLRLVILRLVAEKPRHGYELIKAIEGRAGGAHSPSPGVIYPTLTLLEELGYVAVGEGGGGKKLHEITAEGRAFLEANRPAVEALLARMDEAGRAHGGGPAPQVVRAMENLRLALRLRLARPAERGAGERRRRRAGRRRHRCGGDVMNGKSNPSSVARASTEVPGRYLAQLCERFDRIGFPEASAPSRPEAEHPTMRVAAEDGAALSKPEDAVARHLLRFAFREKPEVHLTRAA